MMKTLTSIQRVLMHGDKPILMQLLYFLSLIVAVILPLIIWQLKLPIVQATYDGSAPGTIESQPFELFGFFITIILAMNTWLKIQKQPKKTLVTVIPIVLPLLVCLNLLFIQVETFQAKSSDYMCYENAAKAILINSNPYAGTPPCYLYPPLLAQILASFHQFTTHNPLFKLTDKAQAWAVATYFYQCGQFFQVVLAYYLTSLLTQNLKIKALPASLLVTFLFLFDYPLIRTLTFDQINLWLLNSCLLGILLLQISPFLSGLAVALGAHIKLYTLALLLPWGLTRKWKAIWGAIVGFVVIACIQTDWTQDWTLWQQFLSYFRSPEKPSNYRNNGIWSLIFNLAKIPGRFLDTDFLFNYVAIIVVGLNLLTLAWFIVRFAQRERIYLKLIKTSSNSEDKSWSCIFRLYGHSIDSIALSLLISPSVWEHHYVLAIPITVWAIATCRVNQLLLISTGAFLIFSIPTFEIFPLSFHRLMGLLMLVYSTAPNFVQDYFTSKPNYEHYDPQAVEN